MNATRLRRIVKFDPKTHFGDVQVTRESRPAQSAKQKPLYLALGIFRTVTDFI